VRWDLAVRDGRIERARFSAWGCPATLAVAAWTAHWLEGRDVATAAVLSGAQMAGALDLVGARRGVALTVEDALRAALAVQPGEVVSAQSVGNQVCPS
jgi:NifU-like protein involved in Fe-S cluster formation